MEDGESGVEIASSLSDKAGKVVGEKCKGFRDGRKGGGGFFEEGKLFFCRRPRRTATESKCELQIDLAEDYSAPSMPRRQRRERSFFETVHN